MRDMPPSSPVHLQKTPKAAYENKENENNASTAKKTTHIFNNSKRAEK